jgi:citrate lyase subunit beta/citryl-CoA lyase
VVAVNAAFTPTADEVAKAEKIVAAFEKAEAAGSASIVVDGFFVDYPVVDQARRTLALIRSIRG